MPDIGSKQRADCAPLAFVSFGQRVAERGRFVTRVLWKERIDAPDCAEGMLRIRRHHRGSR